MKDNNGRASAGVEADKNLIILRENFTKSQREKHQHNSMSSTEPHNRPKLFVPPEITSEIKTNIQARFQTAVLIISPALD